MARRPPPVLRPGATPTHTPLPAAVPLLALLALAVLGFYAVPAVVEHRRLEREHASLEQKAGDAQALLERRRRELRAGWLHTDSSERATRELLNQGAHYLSSRRR